MKPSTAAPIMIAIITAVLLFHTAVLMGIVNYANTWGGRLSSQQQMYIFETISIVINLLLLYTILQKSGYTKQVFSIRVINGILRVFIVIFALNTIGNIFAKSLIEKLAGTAFTAASAFLCWCILKLKK